MLYTQCTRTKYEIELDDTGAIANCFQEDKNCFMQNGHEIATHTHRAPIDAKTALAAITTASKVVAGASVQTSSVISV